MVSSSLADLPSDAEISDVDDEEVEVCIYFLIFIITETKIFFIFQNELVELCGYEDSLQTEKPINKEPSLNMEAVIILLNERLDMYKVAESNASKMGDTMKARR